MATLLAVVVLPASASAEPAIVTSCPAHDPGQRSTVVYDGRYPDGRQVGGQLSVDGDPNSGGVTVRYASVDNDPQQTVYNYVVVHAGTDGVRADAATPGGNAAGLSATGGASASG